MSIEAGYHKYKFRSDKKDEDEDAESEDAGGHEHQSESESGVSDDKAYIRPIRKGPKPADTRLPAPVKSKLPARQSVFRYNPLHDIESLWWLLVYLLLYRSPKIEGYTSSHIAAQSNFYRPFFESGESRLQAFILPSVFTDHGDDLHETLHPISDTLNQIRELLVNRYIEVERGDLSKIDHTVAASLVPQIMKKLDTLERMYDMNDVELSPIRSFSLHRDVEPPAAAATVGASLDSRQFLNVKKHALSDPENPNDAEDPAPGVAEQKKTKRAKRGKKANRSDESASPTRRGGGASRPRSLGRTRSSGSSGDDAPLRRSHRNVKPVKR